MKHRVLLLLAAFLFTSVFAFGQKSRTNSKNDKPPETTFEEELLKEINQARMNPKGYANRLKERRLSIRNKILRLPNRQPMLLNEGVRAVDDAVRDLGNRAPLNKYVHSKMLEKIARVQLKDLLENPSLGHYGKDGSDLGKRIAKFGSAGASGENITYFDLTPEQVVATMLVDDGLQMRTHRNNVLSPKFTLSGAACGKARGYRFICVVVFSEKFVAINKAPRIRSY